MNTIRRLLFRLLGVKNYLKVISKLFFIFYNLKLLKGNPKFDCHYFIRKLIKEGDHGIDLCENTGYYSRNFARLVKTNGRVYSVEPVAMFREVLEKNTTDFKQLTILPYAVGENDGAEIKMGIPYSSKYFSHGKTHVLDNENENLSVTFSATMKRPGSLFGDISRLDYIKCDIEGYEGIAIPLFEEVLLKHRPILQIEIDEKNKQELLAFLERMGYLPFWVDGEHLKPINAQARGDLFFIHSEKTAALQGLIVS